MSINKTYKVFFKGTIVFYNRNDDDHNSNGYLYLNIVVYQALLQGQNIY